MSLTIGDVSIANLIMPVVPGVRTVVRWPGTQDGAVVRWSGRRGGQVVRTARWSGGQCTAVSTGGSSSRLVGL